MDVNIKTEEDFKKYYETNYTNIIELYYDEIRKKKILTIIGNLLLALTLSIIFTYIITSTIQNVTILKENKDMICLLFGVFVFFVAIISIYKSLKKYMYEMNEFVLRDIMAFICDASLEEVKYKPESKLSDESVNKAELFNLDVLLNRGKNYMSVPYNRNNMVFVDMHIYHLEIIKGKKYVYRAGKRYVKATNKKKRTTVFEGVYIGAAMNKKNTAQLYLIPNNFKDTVLQNKIMSYIKFKGVPVMLEDLEFSKKYKVFCDDEVQARYILSLSFMEKINRLDEVIQGKKYIVFKEGKRFAICLEGASLEKTRKRILTSFRNKKREYKTLLKIFNDLNNYIKIYHVLDLGNDLYTAHL